MSNSKIEIKSEQTESGVYTAKIFIDGNQIKGVRGICYQQGLDDRMPVLTLDLNAVDFSLDSPLIKTCEKGMGEIKRIEFENGFVFEKR